MSKSSALFDGERFLTELPHGLSGFLVFLVEMVVWMGVQDSECPGCRGKKVVRRIVHIKI
jgi:hypothetical protein